MSAPLVTLTPGFPGQTSRGLPRGHSLAPFPSWEVQVLLTQVQGLAESSGDAIASGCVGYEWGGAVVLLFLLVTVVTCTFLVVLGMRRKEATWTHVSIKECLQNMKEAMARGKGGLLSRFKAIYEAIGVLHVRGEWDEHDVFLANRIHRHLKHSHNHRTLETRFVERFGPLFDSFHKGAWWYGSWSMLRWIPAFSLCQGVWYAT